MLTETHLKPQLTTYRNFCYLIPSSSPNSTFILITLSGDLRTKTQYFPHRSCKLYHDCNTFSTANQISCISFPSCLAERYLLISERATMERWFLIKIIARYLKFLSIVLLKLAAPQIQHQL